MSENFKNLKIIIDELKGIDLKDLLSPARLGEFSFNELEIDIRSFIDFLDSFARLYEQSPYCPDETFTKNVNRLMTFKEKLAQIKNFSLTENDSLGRKNTLINEIRSLAIQIKDNLRNNALDELLVYIMHDKKADDVNSYGTKAKQALKEIQDLSIETTRRVKDVDDALEAARLAAGTQGVSSYSKIYAADKGSHKKIAIAWLVFTVLMVVGTLSFSAWSFMQFQTLIDNKVSDAFLIQYSISKFLFTGILLLVTLWLARMFRIERNLAFINRQKENALNTFKAFYSSAEDMAIKEAILMETTRSIFSANNSGLVDSGAGNDEVTKIIEIIKSASSKG